jgi:hypothetical protein
LACPYFVPREILNDGSWLHPDRLPLGAGWNGVCSGSGQEFSVDEKHIHDFCNLGYAKTCPHLPTSRDWDAVRFCVANRTTEEITLSYVCERDHAPVAHGTLTYDLGNEQWRNLHSDPRIDRLARSYLTAHRVRQNRSLA